MDVTVEFCKPFLDINGIFKSRQHLTMIRFLASKLRISENLKYNPPNYTGMQV